MEQLPSFLPALFDAFGNQNADVRKVSDSDSSHLTSVPLYSLRSIHVAFAYADRCILSGRHIYCPRKSLLTLLGAVEQYTIAACYYIC